MKPVVRHVTRCFIAGIVALLPITGLVLSVLGMEYTIANTGLRDLPFYFPGLGLIVVGVVVYVIGLLVTTFVGKWLWAFVDGLLQRLPALGTFYATLKQILGYGEGEEAIFKQVVILDIPDADGEEVGLVTNVVPDRDGRDRLLVFVPGSPNPTTGRLLIADPAQVRPLDLKVNDVLQSLVSVGATPLDLTRAADEPARAKQSKQG